jgi:hypothetical protein
MNAPDGEPLVEALVRHQIKLSPMTTMSGFLLRKEHVERARSEPTAYKIPYYGEEGKRAGFLWGFRLKDGDLFCDVAKMEEES